VNNVLKIGVVGPESTGKSELCSYLAKTFKTVWVPEYAREYLKNINRPYTLRDIEKINAGQLTSEKKLLQQANRFLFCDTTPLVNKIWAEFKYGVCPKSIEQSFLNTNYHYYLLCNIDLPWQYDPLREHPHKRKELFTIYKKYLLAGNTPFTVISGIGNQRFQSAIETIKMIKAL